MRVLFVSSECVPFYKRGGLGDVSYALPVALSKLGVETAVVIPYYTNIKISHVVCVGQLAVDFNRTRELVYIFRTTIPGTNVVCYLFRHPRLNDYYGADIVETFAFYSQCVARLYLWAPHIVGGPFDIVHCHDWHTALIPLLIGENYKTATMPMQRRQTIESTHTKTILTIHNLLYQGETGVSIIRKLALPKSVFHVFKTPLGHAVKLLREGLDYADVITTVSPTYAKEILTTHYGDHVNDVLRRRRERVKGILNGIDGTIWDPKTDPFLPVNYDAHSVLTAKAAIKLSLQNALRLPPARVPLFGFVGRLEAKQKGTDLIREAVKALPNNTFQLAMLGTGSPREVKLFEKLAKAYPHVAFVHTFDERLARRIYAGSDIMLVPSRFEPCGLTQMIAMRYGTIPLVRRTGGLADTVSDGRTGFVFDRYNPSALTKKMREVIDYWSLKGNRWQEMVERVMRQDFSWDKSAQDYVALYRKLKGREKRHKISHIESALRSNKRAYRNYVISAH